MASDKLSNPTGALTGESVSEPLVVSNKPPTVLLFKKDITVQPDKSVKLEGAGFHSMIGIAGVQYRVGNGDWTAAAADDGIFDTAFESFSIVTQPLPKGSHTIEVKAIDQAGNSASAKVSVKVE